MGSEQTMGEKTQEKELAGRVVIITGASQGIGAATAQMLATQGAQVALVARSADLLAQVADEIRTVGGTALELPADISDPAQVQAIFDHVARELGPCDILINAAGAVVNVPFIDMELAAWDQVINTNLRGLMLCCQAAF